MSVEKNYRAQTRTLEVINAAKDRARCVEASVLCGEFTDYSLAENTTLVNILWHYILSQAFKTLSLQTMVTNVVK